MSDLRFVDELGAEFEQLERAAAAVPRRRRCRWSTPAALTGWILTAMAVAVPLAIAVLAIALLGQSRDGGLIAGAGGGLALSGGNCRTPARTFGPPPATPPSMVGSDGMIRAAGGRVSGIAWQLRVKPNGETLGGTEHGRLLLGTRQYGLCSRQPVPVPFGLINAGPHGIVYGYVTGGGSYRITVSAGNTPLITTVTDDLLFIGALPRPACSYRELSVTAISTDVTGLPPSIDRSLNEDPTHLTTTSRFGDCRRGALVTVVAEQGRTQGRSPNAPLAQGTAQLKLIAPPGSHSSARGTAWELTHDGARGISMLAVGLSRGRYGIWLLGPHNRAAAVAAVTVRHHELQGAFDLPADARSARQLVVAAQAPGQVDTPGRIVLRAALR